MVIRIPFIFVWDGGKYGKTRQVLHSQARFSDDISLVLFFPMILHRNFFVLRDPCIVILVILIG